MSNKPKFVRPRVEDRFNLDHWAANKVAELNNAIRDFVKTGMSVKDAIAHLKKETVAGPKVWRVVMTLLKEHPPKGKNPRPSAIPKSIIELAIKHGVNLGRDSHGVYFIRDKSGKIIDTTKSAKPTAANAKALIMRHLKGEKALNITSANYNVRHPVKYYSKYEDAIDTLIEVRANHPGARVVEYEKGYAVQYYKSGPYFPELETELIKGIVMKNPRKKSRKAPSKKQLAARKKFAAMARARAKSAKKKRAPKRTTKTRKVRLVAHNPQRKLYIVSVVRGSGTRRTTPAYWEGREWDTNRRKAFNFPTEARATAFAQKFANKYPTGQFRVETR